ncbi:MAG: hypothetical protein RL268_2198, partial [Pseudomonadota bacterium]
KRLAGEGKRIQMPAMILRETDGITPEEARTTAALKNISEGSGTAVDAAKVLRDTDQSADQLGLPPSSALVRDAMGMRNLSQDAFGMVVNGVATEQHGGIVGRVVSDQAAQANILGLLNRLKPANAFQAEQIARQAASETVTETQDSLFGPETDTANLYLERAKVLDAALKRVKDDVKTFRTLVDRAEAVQSAGNVLDAAANQSRLDTDAAVRDYMAKEANTKGAISNALSAAARSLKAGGKPGSVVNDFLAAVEGELGARGGNGQARDSGRATSEPERGTEPEPDLTAEDSGPDLFGDMAPVAEAVADQPKPEQPDATTEIQRNNARRFRKQAADPDFAGTNAERAALVARAEKIEAKHGDAEPAAETYAGQAFTDPPSAEQLRAILPEDADGNPDYSGALKTAMRAVTKVEKPWSRLTDREKVKVANAIIGADGDAKEQRQAEGSDYALAAEVMSELAQVDALFQNPTTQATDLRQAFAEIDPTIKFVGEVNQPAETAELGADSRYLLRTAAGVDFYVMENDGEVWIDVSRLSSGDGGSAIYAAVSDYALNTDRIFIGDPAGLSSAALVRRTDAMLSSALKHGTTRHLAPHQAQIDGDADAGVPPLAWTAGKDADNIRSLIDVSVSSLMSRVPEIEDARYDFRTGTFRAGDGKPLSVRTLAERSYSESGSGAAGVGSASLKRGILLNTLARTTGDGRAGLLEQALRQPGKLASGLRGTFYQQQIEAADAAEARVAKVMPALRKALDRAGLKGVRLVQNRGVDWQGRFMVAPDGVLEIAIGASLSPTNTLNHEVIHALRQMDLFTEQEWRALELKAVQAWMDEFDIAARYPDLLPPQQIEEAIAEAYAAAIDNKTSPKGGLLVTAFNKIARLLKTLRTVLTGKGYDTPESIFGAVWSGEVGRRPRGGGSVSVAKYSIDASLRQKIKAIWDGARPDAPLVLGKTPAVVAALTKKDLPFVMSAAVVKKAGNHGLTMNDLIAAVEGLGDPVMAFDSTNETGNITVLVDAEAADGRAMVVAVEAAFREAKVEVSRIATVHGKDRPDSIIGWMRDGYLRYINKKKAGEWSRSIGRSLPKDMETKHRRGIKILQHRDVFKASGDGAKFQAADQINSPAFKAWFGDSKVVDADGEPLVVYHGTNDGATTSYDFDENQGKVTQRGPIDFDAFNVGAGGAVSFSDTERADTYAGSVSGSRMIPVYLSLKNPLIFDAEGRKWTNVNGGESTAKGAAKPILDINALAVKARADGHDGLIVKNVVDNSIPMGPDGAVPSSDRPATTYMAFSPTQIKSVFNRGTFDPNDPRISYQRARLPSRQARAHMATKMQGAAHIPDRRIWE